MSEGIDSADLLAVLLTMKQRQMLEWLAHDDASRSAKSNKPKTVESVLGGFNAEQNITPNVGRTLGNMIEGEFRYRNGLAMRIGPK